MIKRKDLVEVFGYSPDDLTHKARSLMSVGKLIEYTGIEIQSIDITGNYRDAWYAYKNLSEDTERANLPSSAHGLNWANVHKRLIPQLIRKGLVYSRSRMVCKGIYFILPHIVYQKFEDVIGADIPMLNQPARDTLTVYTYELGPHVAHGNRRTLVQTRKIRFALGDFADRFISGPNLPSGTELDVAVKTVLGTK